MGSAVYHIRLLALIMPPSPPPSLTHSLIFLSTNYFLCLPLFYAPPPLPLYFPALSQFSALIPLLWTEGPRL